MIVFVGGQKTLSSLESVLAFLENVTSQGINCCRYVRLLQLGTRNRGQSQRDYRLIAAGVGQEEVRQGETETDKLSKMAFERSYL